MTDVTLPGGMEGGEPLDVVLDRVVALLARWIAFPTPAACDAVALWIAHCHEFEAFDSTPRLALVSAEKGSGKTRTLEVLELLAADAYHAVSLSPAALYRIIDQARPTFLLDEADTYLGPLVAQQHEDLRGLVNAGHRRGAMVWRCETTGKTITPKAYNAYCPVALASIGDLPDTIIDRSIVVRMRRRGSGELLESFRARHARRLAGPLRAQLAAWAETAIYELADAEPVMPAGIVDRTADVWEPLVAIADAAGEGWPDRARSAAVTLNAEGLAADPSLGVLLLRDVRAIFLSADVERLSTDELLMRLNALVESPWGGLKRGPLDARGLARRLRPYAIRPATQRFGGITAKGYSTADFADTFDRYLPPYQPSGDDVTGDDVIDTDTYEDRNPELF